MCTMVYVASNRPIPLRPWNPAAPAFNVQELKESEQPVRERFSLPFVCYVGTDEHCGCGFGYGQYPGYEEEAEAERNKKRVSELREFLASLLSAGAHLELYACQADEEGRPATSTVSLRIDEIGGTRFWLEEGQLVHFAEQSA